MSISSSALLLGTVTTSVAEGGSSSLRPDQRAALKAVLDLPGAAAAVSDTDEFMGVYENPAMAVEAALAFQNAVDNVTSVGPGSALIARLVLDAWPANVEQMPVERLREILLQTREHCVLVTQELSQLLPQQHQSQLVAHPPVIANSGVYPVLELPWREQLTTFRESTRQVSVKTSKRPEVQSAIKLTRRGRSFTVYAADCPFTIGRDSACALTIGGPDVSRLHGAILFEHRQFYFRDDSRNGTYITTSGDEIFVHSQRQPLFGRGVISPGVTLVEQTGDVIRFECQSDGSPDNS